MLIHKMSIRLFLFCLLTIGFLIPKSLVSQDLGYDYFQKWQAFYPQKAISQGLHAAIYKTNDLSSKEISDWLEFNQTILDSTNHPNSSYSSRFPNDSRLLKVQAQNEIHKWSTEKPHINDPLLYIDHMKQVFQQLSDAPFLLEKERSLLTCERLRNLQDVALSARNQLVYSSEKNRQQALTKLISLSKSIRTIETCNTVPETIQEIEKLSLFIEGLEDMEEPGQILGTKEYNRRLALYTDSDLTSEKLSSMALEEINTVKRLIVEESKKYFQSTYPGEIIPEEELLVELVMSDMEKDVPQNARDYLEFWLNLKQAAMEFVEQKDLATLPESNTLEIKTAPESAGPAARIGWVQSAPPFHPNPMTTLYLPSIPDTVPEQEQIDFWSSFNRPFNRMIVIHELVPGHYMQLKISRETAHPIRLLFPYGVYIEGWATFCEKVALEKGWESERPLTYIAHLRKRLENANRAYTSVKVHCEGWSQEDVLKFSTDTAWVAPQFAKSLWGRILRSPMQLTSYYLGREQFTKLYNYEKARLGDDFDLKYFMDTIMKAGPIPVDGFYEIFTHDISD